MKISVYGTLRRGCGANDMLNKCEFLGKTKESLNFVMVSLGAFPALIETNSKNDIVVETYEISENDNSTMKVLDRYEGYPNFYQRKPITLSSGEESMIYYLNQEEDGGGRSIRNLEEYEVIKSGDWMEF